MFIKSGKRIIFYFTSFQNMAFVCLKILINQAVASAGLKDSVEAANICDSFLKVIDEKLGSVFARKCHAVKFKDGDLTIRVEGSAFAQELELEKRDVLGLLNKKLERNIVKRIKFEI